MKIIFVITIFISAQLLFAQGFDWQYSYRGQTNFPKYFIGLTSEFGFTYHTGSINYSENLIPCCKFREGNGFDYKIGVVSEYWLNGGENSIIGAICYKSSNASFYASPDPVYYLHDTLYTELEFRNSISLLQISFIFKHRINLSHFFFAGGMGLDFLASNSYEHSEKIISSDLTFNDGTIIRKIDSGEISKLSNILLSPELVFGYDFNLGLGLYASVMIGMKMNINEISDDTDWHKYSFNLGINILKGL